MQAHDAEAVEQVLAKAPLADERVEVGVGGDDQPDVDAARLRFTDRVDLVRFEEAKQLGLDLETGIADLVEEQRAAGGGAHDALEVVDGAGERAAPVAEQLRVKHVLGRRRAVEREEGRLGAGGAGVDRPGEHFLARARFAGDEDGDVGRRNAARDGEDALHLLGEEDGAALAFDGISGPQRGAVALLLAGVLQRERGATEAKNVA